MEKYTLRLINGLQIDRQNNNKTLLTEKKRGKRIIEEPDVIYLWYITPTPGTADFSQREMYILFDWKCLSRPIKILECDDTHANFEKFDGNITLIEKRFKKPLQQFISKLIVNRVFGVE